jgi:hypothetical protein
MTKSFTNTTKTWQKFKYLGMTVTNRNYIHKETEVDKIWRMLSTVQSRILNSSLTSELHVFAIDAALLKM